jgi:hypothetical protein
VSALSRDTTLDALQRVNIERMFDSMTTQAR